MAVDDALVLAGFLKEGEFLSGVGDEGDEIALEIGGLLVLGNAGDESDIVAFVDEVCDRAVAALAVEDFDGFRPFDFADAEGVEYPGDGCAGFGGAACFREDGFGKLGDAVELGAGVVAFRDGELVEAEVEVAAASFGKILKAAGFGCCGGWCGLCFHRGVCLCFGLSV